MYKVKEIPLEKFKEFKVPKDIQDEIIFRHGKPLDPEAGYKLLKKETKNFTVSGSLAEEADQLLYALLYPSEKTTANSIEKREKNLKIKKKGLALTTSMLKLKLKLKLKLAAQKQSA